MSIPLHFYWSLFLRRLPVMVGLFLVCSVVGTIAALKLPPTYSASARLQVEAPQIPEGMIASTIQTEAAEQLQLIEEQLMTRANLIDIAQKYRVFDDIATMTPDSIVAAMRQNTRIRRSSGRSQATLMSVSFSAATGNMAANVVNDYVTLILEANSSNRRARAQNTLSFFQQESERLANDLDRKSNEIINFKNQNVNALPDDLEYRQNRQAALQERLSRLEQDRASIASQRAEMISIFEATGRLSAGVAASGLSPSQQRIAELELELSDALTIYSESNPKVVLLRNQIEKLQSSTDADLARDDPAEQPEEISILDVTLAEMDQRVEDINQEIARVDAELVRLADSIAATAANSITLERMERDQESIQSRYNTILNNLNQARMAERIEVTAQGQRISLIEGASVPQDPSGPPRLRIAATGIAGGLGLAAGFFFLLELLNRKIRHPGELRSRFGIMPIGIIPYMESRRERIIRRGLLVAAFLAVTITVPAALYYIDTQYMPLEVLANRVLIKLGLV